LLTSINWTITTGIVVLVILLIFSALISGAEVAFFSLSKTDLDDATNGKSDKKKIVAEQLKKPKKLLATVLIANNFINILIILLFTYIGDYFFNGIHSTILRFALEVILITFLILLFGEVLPKIYANRNAMKFAIFMAIPIKILNSILSFVSIPLMSLTNLVEKRFEKKQSDFSVEQLSQALELTSEEATSEDEQKILEGIVSFGNTDTAQVMCPRMDVFALSDEESYADVVSQIIKNGHSRIPVYHESMDDIIGILYTKDILPHLEKKTFQWKKILREPFFVPENKKLDDLLKEFQEKKNHLAIVVDEYGGTSGIVTLEDVIEEIVGDISDEFDDDDLSYSKIDESNYVFDGKIVLKDFYKILEIDETIFEEKKGEAETLAGFILEFSGRFPKKNEILNFSSYQFKIEALDKKRIKQVKVTLPNE
jgi:gliding motility-associated protein GldE